MKQAITGVAPPQLEEVTIMCVWPSVAALAGGRFFGKLYEISLGAGMLPFGLTLGKIIALLSVPFILPPYFLMLSPWNGRRYRLTNRRVIIQQGFDGNEAGSVSLDRFDEIEVKILPGQDWYKAGELIFKQAGTETFRLTGVPRPETFRQTCLKARDSYVMTEAVMA